MTLRSGCIEHQILKTMDKKSYISTVIANRTKSKARGLKPTPARQCNQLPVRCVCFAFSANVELFRKMSATDDGGNAQKPVGRRREPRRHTLASGVDYNMVTVTRYELQVNPIF